MPLSGVVCPPGNLPGWIGTLIFQSCNFVAFFLSWMAKSQRNHWTTRVVNTQITASDRIDCPRPLPTPGNLHWLLYAYSIILRYTTWVVLSPPITESEGSYQGPGFVQASPPPQATASAPTHQDKTKGGTCIFDQRDVACVRLHVCL